MVGVRGVRVVLHESSFALGLGGKLSPRGTWLPGDGRFAEEAVPCAGAGRPPGRSKRDLPSPC
jgi:hypothetical protein